MAKLNNNGTEEFGQTSLKVGIYQQGFPQHPIHEFFLEDTSQLVGCAVREPPNFEPATVDRVVMDNCIFVAQQVIMYLNTVSK
eukprot:gene23852-190_t